MTIDEAGRTEVGKTKAGKNKRHKFAHGVALKRFSGIPRYQLDWLLFLQYIFEYIFGQTRTTKQHRYLVYLSGGVEK